MWCFLWISAGLLIRFRASSCLTFFFSAGAGKARKKEVEYIHAEKLRVTKCAFDRIFEFLPPLLILECSINKPALLCHTRVELLSGGMQATWYRIWNCFFQLLVTWRGLLARHRLLSLQRRDLRPRHEKLQPAIGAWGCWYGEGLRSIALRFLLVPRLILYINPGP